MLEKRSYKETPRLDYRIGIWRIEVNGMEAFTHEGFWGTQVVYIPSLETALATNYSQIWIPSKVRGAPAIPKIVILLREQNPTQ